MSWGFHFVAKTKESAKERINAESNANPQKHMPVVVADVLNSTVDVMGLPPNHALNIKCNGSITSVGSQLDFTIHYVPVVE